MFVDQFCLFYLFIRWLSSIHAYTYHATTRYAAPRNESRSNRYIAVLEALLAAGADAAAALDNDGGHKAAMHLLAKHAEADLRV